MVKWLSLLLFVLVKVGSVGRCVDAKWLYTVRAEIFAVVLFSRISRVKPSRKFPLQFMSIYSNDNISKIMKLIPRELPHLAKTAKITVRENNGVYSNANTYSTTLVMQGYNNQFPHHVHFCSMCNSYWGLPSLTR